MNPRRNLSEISQITWSMQVKPSEASLSDASFQDEAYATSPTACLLRQADLSPDPEDGDKDVDVDLYQTALLVLAHLDRLAAPFVQHRPSKVRMMAVLNSIKKI